MAYIKTASDGRKYIEGKNGNRWYARNSPKFQPIDYSKPKVQQPGLAANLFNAAKQKLLNNLA